MNRENGHPVVIGCTQPFRVVLKSETDIWAPSLDEVNSSEYSHVMLSRLSTSFDVGLSSNYCLHVGFCGAIILPAIAEIGSHTKAVDIMNSYLAKLLVGGMYYDAVGLGDLGMGSLYATGYFRIHGDNGGASIRQQQALQQKNAGPLDTISLYHPQSVSVVELHSAWKAGVEFTEQVPTLSLQMLQRCVSSVRLGGWVDALWNAWICIEQLVEHLWVERIREVAVGAPQKISGRIAFLDDSRSWTVANKIELLYQKEIVAQQDYEFASAARKARNALAHRGTSPGQEVCKNAVRLVFRLLSWVAKGNPDSLDEVADSYLEPEILKEERAVSGPISEFPEDGLWLGPFPPIPGEANWDGGDFEEVLENNDS